MVLCRVLLIVLGGREKSGGVRSCSVIVVFCFVKIVFKTIKRECGGVVVQVESQTPN